MAGPSSPAKEHRDNTHARPPSRHLPAWRTYCLFPLHALPRSCQHSTELLPLRSNLQSSPESFTGDVWAYKAQTNKYINAITMDLFIVYGH